MQVILRLSKYYYSCKLGLHFARGMHEHKRKYAFDYCGKRIKGQKQFNFIPTSFLKYNRKINFTNASIFRCSAHPLDPL